MKACPPCPQWLPHPTQCCLPLSPVPAPLPHLSLFKGQTDNTIITHMQYSPEGQKILSVEQGFWKPRGYAGKGLEGRGQGMEQLTPHKPLPMSTGKGIPLLLQAGKFAPVF